MLRKIFTFPARNLIFIIPVVISAALLCGYFVDTSSLKKFIIPAAMMAVYPAMIGLKPREVVIGIPWLLLILNLLLNFIVIPVLAFMVARIVLAGYPDLQTGLLIISVIPGGNMVMAFTLLLGGNVGAALKISTINLVLGALLAPVYLHFMVGKAVHVNMLQIFETVGLVVFVPMILGMISFYLLLKRYSEEDFKSKIKPLLPALSSWFMIYIIFTSVSVKARMILSQPEMLFRGLLALLIWYFLVIGVSGFTARAFFPRKDAITLFLNGQLRNLAIAMGLAVTAFSPTTSMMVALAFLFQQQGALWFCRIEKKYNFFNKSD